LFVENREHLWNLLLQAAQLAHLIMCQYLYASFSLKTEPDEGLAAIQAEAVARWRKTLTGIAVEEMLHLALAANVMTAIGAAPSLARPELPAPFRVPSAQCAVRVPADLRRCMIVSRACSQGALGCPRWLAVRES
jgi:Ferritin-like